MGLKIKSIDAKIVNLGLTRPYSIAYKTVDSVDNVIVRIEAEDGSYGLGAANPSKYVVEEENEDVLQQLSEERLEAFIGREITKFFELIGEVHTRFTSVGARIALEVALHDLFTKHLGVRLVDFYGQRVKSLPTSVTIGIKDVTETIEEANEYIGNGFKILKVKLGKSVDEDIERMHKLIEEMPSEIKVRIDANQGWSVEDTIKFHVDTMGLDIELIEQPLKQDGVEEMRVLPGDLKNIIAADESLISPKDALILAQDPIASGIFNIKLMKCAGLTKAKDIAVIAENAGIDLMWGCNDESVISITAALHIAFSCANTKYIDLDGSLDLATDVATGGFILEEGMMRISNKPGLGLEWQEA